MRDEKSLPLPNRLRDREHREGELSPGELGAHGSSSVKPTRVEAQLRANESPDSSPIFNLAPSGTSEDIIPYILEVIGAEKKKQQSRQSSG